MDEFKLDFSKLIKSTITYKLLDYEACVSYGETIRNYMSELITEETEFLKDTGYDFPHNQSTLKEWDSRVLAENSYGAFSGTELVGVVSYIAADKSMCGLYVAPKYRGKGVGKTLAKMVLDNFDVENINVVYTNKSAMGLYESLGYKVIPIFAMAKK